MTRTILYATDFSAASRPALAMAVELARQARARLLVLHVMTPASPFVAREERPASWLELQAWARRDARRHLAATVATAGRARIRVEGTLVEGVPAESILRLARRQGADLIVIGTHGRSGVGRFLMGSVAARVVQFAHCSVLTVRGRRRGGSSRPPKRDAA
ncbi:MAG TPA: universal stress protein [Candidatus Limnocylindrales bacterium]|nr:universal stress protein [Candidatus Limnocylindrales bacterium]